MIFMEKGEEKEITTCLLALLWRDCTHSSVAKITMWSESGMGLSFSCIAFYNLYGSAFRHVEIVHVPVA